jgi:ubiquitin C
MAAEGGEESEERKPLARKIKLVRTLKGSVTGTVTIPVLTTDRIIELRKKIKRSLQPLVERNLSMMQTPQREPKHIDITPGACKISAMNPSSSCTRPPLSSSSSSPAEKAKQNAVMRQKLVAAGGSFSSPLPPPLPPPTPSSSSSASPLSASRLPVASAARLHLEHPSSSALKTTSARRLEFEPAIGTPRKEESSSNGAAKNCSKLELEGGSMLMRAQESCRAEMMMPKRSLGAWINSSVQALAGQIRGAQIVHNQSTEMEGMN